MRVARRFGGGWDEVRGRVGRGAVAAGGTSDEGFVTVGVEEASVDTAESSTEAAGVGANAIPSSFPMGPPGPPPQRGLKHHHFAGSAGSGLFSSRPSRLRCWAATRRAAVSRARSRSSSSGLSKDVACRADIAARGPSMMPPRAERRSEGVR